MMPVIAYNLLQSIELLAGASGHLARRCVDARDFLEGQATDGVRRIEADEARCRESVEKSLAMCTALAPRIGYDNAAALAKAAYHQGRTVRDLAESLVGLTPEAVVEALGPPASVTGLKEFGGYPTMDEVRMRLDPLGQTIPATESGGAPGG